MLETTIDGDPEQAAQLEAILASDYIRAGELPAFPELIRSPKKATPTTGDLFDFDDEG